MDGPCTAGRVDVPCITPCIRGVHASGVGSDLRSSAAALSLTITSLCRTSSLTALTASPARMWTAAKRRLVEGHLVEGQTFVLLRWREVSSLSTFAERRIVTALAVSLTRPWIVANNEGLTPLECDARREQRRPDPRGVASPVEGSSPVVGSHLRSSQGVK